jgi:hypothetical protein
MRLLITHFIIKYYTFICKYPVKVDGEHFIEMVNVYFERVLEV